MRADRLISILMMLQSKGRMTAQNLAEELEVSVRTIYRDVTALGSSGVPIYTEPGPGGGISLMDHYRSDLTGLTSEEVQALFMLSIPTPLVHLGMDRRLKGALYKLSAALPAVLRADEQLARQRVYIDSEGWEQYTGTPPHLLTLQRAAWADQRLVIVYRTQLGDRAGPLTAEIEPYGLVAKAGEWYLVAFQNDHFMVLRVERILRLVEKGESFERAPDFGLVSYWRAWCAENQEQPRFMVTVQVAEGLRPYLSDVLGDFIAKDEEGAEKAENGGWSRRLLVFSSFEEARGRILALGRAIKVVEPLSLKLSVLDFAQQISTLYEDDNLSQEMCGCTA